MRSDRSRSFPAQLARQWRWILTAAWALLITWLLLGPPGWGWGPLRPAGHILGMVVPFLSLVSRQAWEWGVGWAAWRDIAVGAAGLGVMAFAGWLLLRCFVVFVPRGVGFALAFVLGIGVCGVAYTFLAILGVLYQWLALVVLFVLFGVLWFAARMALVRADLPVGDDADRNARVSVWNAQRDVALEWERRTWLQPSGAFERGLARAMRILIGLITALTFFHALFFPVVYWDSMILYVGYARDIFLQHQFPIKVTAQVGVGLGANYPHLFELTGALIATWANHWSTLYQQLLSPLAGLFTVLLVYHTALRQSRSVLIALAAALLVRAIPYVIAYNVWTSAYCLVMLFSAAFLYCALRYIEDGLPGYFAIATLIAAFGMHLSYIMGTLWIAWAAMILVAHWPRRQPREIEGARWHEWIGVGGGMEYGTPDFVQSDVSPSLSELLATGRFWRWAAAGIAIGAVWYVRNWIVTGNPVYAFFDNIFGGRNINPAVLESARVEWMRHGDGVGLLGEGLWRRLLLSWPFFVNNRSTCWKWAPVFVGIVAPGILVYIVTALRQSFVRRRVPDEPRPALVIDDSVRFGFVAFAYLGILFFYQYVLSPFYLYHLLGGVAAFGVFIVFAVDGAPRWVRRTLAVWAVWCGIVPGIALGLVGMKLFDQAGLELVPLRYPGMPAERFYQLRFGQDPIMWRRVNMLCKGQPLLTHENRRLAFDPSIRLVHMDDWDVQQLWKRPESDRLRALQKMGVRYYLQVPYEFDHAINATLGHRGWIESGILIPVFQTRGSDGRPSILYEFKYPDEFSEKR